MSTLAVIFGFAGFVVGFVALVVQEKFAQRAARESEWIANKIHELQTTQTNTRLELIEARERIAQLQQRQRS